jgi:hypothetical protein
MSSQPGPRLGAAPTTRLEAAYSGAVAGATVGAIATVLWLVLFLACSAAVQEAGTKAAPIGWQVIAVLVWAFVDVVPGAFVGAAAAFVKKLWVAACVGALAFVAAPLGWMTLLRLQGEHLAGADLGGAALVAVVPGVAAGAAAFFWSRRRGRPN